MSDTGENYTTFNSRALVEVVGDVTDEALKATKIKQLLSVLAGRFFNWAGRKSLFTLHLGIKCCAIEMAASMVQFDAAWEIDALAKLGSGALPTTPPLRAQLSAPDELVTLHDAVDRNCLINFVYGGESREIEPVLVFWRQGAWYLHGYEDGVAKNFKVERFQSSVTIGVTGSARNYPAPKPAEAMSEDPLLHGPESVLVAQVLIDPLLARQVERDRGGVIERRTDGSVVIEVDVRSPGAFRSWLFGMGDHAVVLSPPEMVADTIAWLRALVNSK